MLIVDSFFFLIIDYIFPGKLNLFWCTFVISVQTLLILISDGSVGARIKLHMILPLLGGKGFWVGRMVFVSLSLLVLLLINIFSVI